MGTTCELDLELVEIDFMGEKTRQISITLFVDGQMGSRLVIDRDDLLWLLEPPK